MAVPFIIGVVVLTGGSISQAGRGKRRETRLSSAKIGGI
jgi:hypothetical protein